MPISSTSSPSSHRHVMCETRLMKGLRAQFRRISALPLLQAVAYSLHCRMECQLRICVTGDTTHVRWWMWGRKA